MLQAKNYRNLERRRVYDKGIIHKDETGVGSWHLAAFKKTVAMHEVFLCYAAARPILRKDLNFYNFLELNKDLSVRGKRMKRET